MSFLFKLPDVIRFDSMNDWLVLKDLKYLDSAFCNVENRIMLLALFNHHLFTLKGNKVETSTTRIYESNLFMSWAAIRNLKFRHLILIGYNFKNKQQLKFNINTSKVAALSISNCTENDLNFGGLVGLVNLSIRI
jgi:hypothetical protein